MPELKEDIKLIAPEALKERMRSGGFDPYRAEQVLQWVWKKRARSFVDMLNIPKDLRSFLDAKYFIRSGRVVEKRESSDGTVKLLLTFPGDTYVETVYLPAAEFNTSCVSSQAGCAMKCRFCATGYTGFQRSLEPGEIIEQILLAEEETKGSIRNIVFMGMGEPLMNYDNVLKAVRVINSPYALHIGARNITISTVGIPDGMRRLADEQGLQVRLSVSLHAAQNGLRESLIPINKKYPLEQVLSAARYYSEKAKKYVSFEYALFKGINDSPKQARLLSGKLKGWKARVNLIPFNRVSFSDFRPPDPKSLRMFCDVLRMKGVNATVRKERGADIEAACGQLKLKKTGEKC
jgi:23S rRNA (adenine2503-C2)-methyltransferase